jgi:hypothetical protein
MGLDSRLQRLERGALAATQAETRARQAQGRRQWCGDCGGLTASEVRGALATLPVRFIVGQSGHPREEDVIIDLERSEPACARCGRPTVAGIIAQALKPCALCGPSPEEDTRVLVTFLGEPKVSLAAIGMLPERCPRCNVAPPWTPRGIDARQDREES